MAKQRFREQALEIEREHHSLSMLIMSSSLAINWDDVIEEILLNLVNSNGVWVKEFILDIGIRGVRVKKAKHSKKSKIHKAKLLAEKLI